MTFLRLTLVTLIAVFLTACGTNPSNPQAVKIMETRVERVKIPQALTQPCQPEQPASQATFLQLKPHEREEELTRYSVSLLGTIKECNVKLKKIEKISATPDQ